MRRPALVACAAVLLGAAPASARIVVQQGMAGVRLGETWAQTRAHFGTPPASNRVLKSEILGHVRVVRWGHVTISFDGVNNASKAIAFDTTGTSQRTSNGIGVGSTEAAVAAKLPRARCKASDHGYHHCWIGRFGVAGARVTDFAINTHGRVGRVTVGIVID
jgi:hypothetical protein